MSDVAMHPSELAPALYAGYIPPCGLSGCDAPMVEDAHLEVALTIGSTERVVRVPLCEGHRRIISEQTPVGLSVA